jgi:hypothetical protein
MWFPSPTLLSDLSEELIVVQLIKSLPLFLEPKFSLLLWLSEFWTLPIFLSFRRPSRSLWYPVSMLVSSQPRKVLAVYLFSQGCLINNQGPVPSWAPRLLQPSACLTYPPTASLRVCVRLLPQSTQLWQLHSQTTTTELVQNKKFSSALNVDAAINLVTLGSFTCELRQQYRQSASQRLVTTTAHLFLQPVSV